MMARAVNALAQLRRDLSVDVTTRLPPSTRFVLAAMIGGLSPRPQAGQALRFRSTDLGQGKLDADVLATPSFLENHYLTSASFYAVGEG